MVNLEEWVDKERAVMQRKFLNVLGVMIVVLGAVGLVWAKNDSLPPTSILKGNNRIFTCVFYEGAVADYQQSSKSANSVLAWCYVMIEKTIRMTVSTPQVYTGENCADNKLLVKSTRTELDIMCP